jgi:heterodisulfide reductase subunit A
LTDDEQPSPEKVEQKPKEDKKSSISPQPPSQPIPQATPQQIPQSIPQSTPQQSPQPTPQHTPQAIPQPTTSQPPPQPTTEPVSQSPIPQPTIQPTTQTVSQSTPEPAPQPTPQPSSQPTPQPSSQPTPQPQPTQSTPQPPETQPQIEVPSTPISKDGTVGAVLIVGGGISGMQSALDLAESGYMIYLVDKSPSIGGAMAQLDKTFPTNDCAMCIMAPKLVSTGRHHNIKLITNAEIENVSGESGNFQVTVRKMNRYVDETKCTGCGICTQKCPVEVPDEYNKELKVRKAIYVRYPQSVPLIFKIDKEYCIGCGNCERYCRAGAIKYDQEEEILELNVGSIILSPGFKEFQLSKKREYGYGRFLNVISSLELERMLSATGPYGGMLLRPSDGKVPKNIAFIQCVGSRDKNTGNTYCSSVCCMFAIKEGVIAQEHTPGLECTIFFMDMRAFGKEFDDYYIRAEKEHKIKFIRNNRIAKIEEDPITNNLKLNFIKGGKLETAEFDMVALSVGMEAPEDAKILAEKFGIELNKFNFSDTNIFTPMETNRPGIFVSGAFSAPKDIPDSVAQASGAAGNVNTIISDARGSLITEKEYPPELDITGQEPRIGVFICHCGINIGGVVDVQSVVEYAGKLPGVLYTEHNLYTCSQDTQEKIKEKVKEHNLNRVIVASCTPRTHEPLFQNTIREAGLNAFLFEMTNIRDQCSWVHMHEPELATEKAKDLVRMAVAKAKLIEPLQRKPIEINPNGLIIGGGLSGITAALSLRKQGFGVHLIEREPELGGHLKNLYYTNNNDDIQEYLQSLKDAIEADPDLKVYTSAKIKSVTGCIGSFTTTIEQNGTEKNLEHGIIIVATGGKEYKPTEYLYGQNPRIITQLELERRIANNELGESKKFVMIQCVGSRNEERPYCSRVCCTEAVKNALKIKEKIPNSEVIILFRDMRTYGFREDFYTEAAGNGVHFIRYYEDSLPEVKLENGEVNVFAKEHLIDQVIHLKPDYLVLSTATIPDPENEILSQHLKVPLSKDKFFLEAHMKLRPVDFATEGVFLCGLAHSPKFIEECIYQANGAVARAVTILSKKFIEGEATISVVNETKCIGCGTCVDTCEYGAPELVKREDGTLVSHVNEALCKGCGACAVACCNGAITTKHFDNNQIMSMVEAALSEPELESSPSNSSESRKTQEAQEVQQTPEAEKQEAV